MDKREVKRSKYGALDFYKQESDKVGSIINDDLKAKARASMGTTVKYPVIKKNSITIGSTRSLTIADNENDSALVTVSWTTLTGGFSMYPARYHNNWVEQAPHYDRHLLELMVGFAEAIEDLCVANLAANKSQLSNDSLGYTFTGNQFDLGLAEKDWFFSDIPVIMAQNKFFDEGINVVSNYGTQSFINKLSQQGSSNDVNYGYQFAGSDYFYTNNIANASGMFSTFYFCPSNVVGLLTRNEPDAIMGSSTEDGHQWDVGMVPVVNLPFDLYYYEGAVDASSIDTSMAHLKRTVRQAFGFSVDVALVNVYNSDAATYPNPVMKAQIAST